MLIYLLIEYNFHEGNCTVVAIVILCFRTADALFFQ